MEQRLITPTKISSWLGCDHSLFLSLTGAEVDGGGLSELANILTEKGLEHEAACLEELRVRQGTTGELKLLDARKNDRESFDQWLERIGNPLLGDYDVIYQMPFLHEGVRGVADFLVRSSEPSDEYAAFEPVDAKLTRSGAKPGHVIQLCFYSEAIAALCGKEPRKMHIWLGSGRTESHQVEEFMAYWRRVRRQFIDVFSGVTPIQDSKPHRCQECEYCEYQQRCEKQWRDTDALEFVATATRKDINRLENAGVSTLVQLAGRREPVESMKADRLSRLARQAQLQVANRESDTEVPPFELISPSDDPLYGRGLEMLPAPDDGDIFLDFEGDPFWKPVSDLLFLAGIYMREDGEWRYQSFWAHSLEEQSAMVSKLVRLFWDRKQVHPNMHVYHYNHTERSAIERLVDGARDSSIVESLKRSGFFIDLYPIVKNTFVIGAESYGLKDLERLVGFTRTTEIDKGAGAVIEYERWLKDANEKHLDNIALYNRDDVIATKKLRDWVVKNRPLDIAFRDPEFENSSRDEERDTLAVQLLEYPEGSAEHLLGHLLSYWSKELSAGIVPVLVGLKGDFDDISSTASMIAGVSFLEEISPSGREKIPCARFTFPPQDLTTDFEDSDEIIYINSQNKMQSASIRNFDPVNRTFDVPWNKAKAEGGFPSSIALYKIVNHGAKLERLKDIGRSLLADPSHVDVKRLSLALLENQPPRFADSFAWNGQFSEQPEGILKWADQLVDSFVPIQGPPGTGKTFRAARIIEMMISRGKRVGVMGPSHSAIENLMRAVATLASENGQDPKSLNAAKWNGSHEGVDLEDFATYPKKRSDIFSSNFQLIGGTSWLWASEEFIDNPVDLLLIDEAGQVSLADAISASMSAKSILLLGDPLQLAQVSQSSHASDAGKSVLEYALGEHLTVPPDRGVFISTTRRMHPDVCRFISQQMYEGRLTSDEACARQSTEFGTGLRWLRAEHTGRSTFAPEEVSLIVDQIKLMLDTTYVNRDGETNVLQESDFMVVAPFNAQRREMRKQLASEGLLGVEVGTVDKFQGRESVVVFFSMTTSSEAEIERGKDFLFSRNRLNVAVSRARSLAFLVCTEELLNTRASDVETMRLISTVNSFIEFAGQ